MTMNNQEMVKKLVSLAQLDIDAVYCYGQAIEEIEQVGIRQQIIHFRDDHERHISELFAVIRDLGGEPPAYSRDFKGFLLEGFTAIRSLTGTPGALKAMQTNENLTNSNYGDACSWDLTPSVMAIIERNYADEKRHLQYIDQAIANRIWEK